jgi:hypothetical protein
VRRITDGNRQALVGVAIPVVALLGIVVTSWSRVLAVLKVVMAILAGLLVLKAAFVAVSVVVRLFR